MSEKLGNTFKWLFFPAIVIMALVGLVATDIWLFGIHGVAQPLRQALYHPALFLPILGAVVLAAAFHETGHASGCTYGGGHPGRMGCGLYLAWPAFYTDVTDAYRLGKRDRLRTDLGGVYFNVLVILLAVGVYALSGNEAVLLVVLLEHFEIAHQLLPLVRLDGYYIVADLTGVPDLFTRIGPILRSALPWRPDDPSVTVLKRSVRIAVTAWVSIVVPLLIFEFLVVLVQLPHIVGTAWSAGVHLDHAAKLDFAHGKYLAAVASGFQIAVLAIPLIGIALMVYRTFISATKWLKKRTEGRPARQAASILGVAALAAGLLFAWLPSRQYRPISPSARGTLLQGTVALPYIVTNHQPPQRLLAEVVPAGPNIAPTNSPPPAPNPGSLKPSTPTSKKTHSGAPAKTSTAKSTATSTTSTTSTNPGSTTTIQPAGTANPTTTAPSSTTTTSSGTTTTTSNGTTTTTAGG